MTRGVCYIAYGAIAEAEVQRGVELLNQYHTLSYAIAAEVRNRYCVKLRQPQDYDNVQRSRWAKVMLDLWTPFDDTLYLDADTRVQGDLSRGFDMLDDGWEMLITPSTNQGSDNMWHVAEPEREETYLTYQCSDVLQLQGGVFWFRKCEAVTRLFAAWREQWQHYARYDQAALLRALRVAPVKLHLLGRPFNGGAVVQHRFGQAVR